MSLICGLVDSEAIWAGIPIALIFVTSSVAISLPSFMPSAICSAVWGVVSRSFSPASAELAGTSSAGGGEIINPDGSRARNMSGHKHLAVGYFGRGAAADRYQRANEGEGDYDFSFHGVEFDFFLFYQFEFSRLSRFVEPRLAGSVETKQHIQPLPGRSAPSWIHVRRAVGPNQTSTEVSGFTTRSFFWLPTLGNCWSV